MASRCHGLNGDGAQSLGSGVHRGGQPRRPSADDRQVILRQRRRGHQAQTGGHGFDRGGGELRPVGEQADRQAVEADVGRVEHGLDAVWVLDIDPFVRDAVPAEEVPDLVADRGRPEPHDDDLRGDGPGVVVEHRLARLVTHMSSAHNFRGVRFTASTETGAVARVLG